jgi:L-2-hydroxyglutarate oxidase LhgO
VDVDVLVVGAGAVGLAIAAELSSRTQVAVVERHDGYGRENSSHNSGVIHAGIYYPTGSLKHELCLEGNRLLYGWCERYGVRARRLGKLIVAADDADLPALDAVELQARANGVPEVERIGAGRAAELEPAVRCVAAIWSRTTGVVDQAALMASYAAVAQGHGAWTALRHAVVAAERANSGFTVAMHDPDGAETAVTCRVLVNSAGLGAPAVAQMLGYALDGSETSPPLRQRVNRGRYYDIVSPEKARALRHLVYPVPDHAGGGLGVHVTIDIDGGAHLGPDTEWLDDGAPLDFRSRDDRRQAFAAAARRYLPSITPDDLAPGQTGYRPKLAASPGAQSDFLIWHDRGYVHLGGIESPGLTASLAIARRVAALLQ